MLKYDNIVRNDKKNIAFSGVYNLIPDGTIHFASQTVALLIGRGSGNITVSTDYGRSSGLV